MSHSANLVSVVIPCYNHGKYLKDSVQSALNQTYKNVEVIVVNDGSTDEQTLNEFENLPSEVRILHKENGHLSSARNYGFHNAKGQFVLVLDADDKFDVRFLEKAVPMMISNEDVGMVACWVQYFGDENKIAETKEAGLIEMITKNTNCGNLLVRKKAWEEVGGYDENMKQGLEDWNFSIAVLSKGFELKIIEEPLFFYRKEGDSMSTETRLKRAEIYMQLFQNHKELFMNNIEQVIYEKELEITRLRNLLESSQKKIIYLENSLKNNGVLDRIKKKIGL
jgi:hypothetical protein